VEAFDISPKELKNFVIYGFKRSFFPHLPGKAGICAQHHQLLRSMEKRFGISLKNDGEMPAMPAGFPGGRYGRRMVGSCGLALRGIFPL
jgi:hypothetical protein